MAEELEKLPSQRDMEQAEQQLGSEISGLERDVQFKSGELKGVPQCKSYTRFHVGDAKCALTSIWLCCGCCPCGEPSVHDAHMMKSVCSSMIILECGL